MLSPSPLYAKVKVWVYNNCLDQLRITIHKNSAVNSLEFFQSVEDVKAAVEGWNNTEPKVFQFWGDNTGIHLAKCIMSEGNYIENEEVDLKWK